MKPAEIVTVAVAVPMVAALFAAAIAEGRPQRLQPVVTGAAQAADMVPAAFGEIVVTAKRPAARNS